MVLVKLHGMDMKDVVKRSIHEILTDVIGVKDQTLMSQLNMFSVNLLFICQTAFFPEC